MLVTHTRGNYVDFPNFQYDVDHVVWADADHPDTEEFEVRDTYIRNGDADWSVVLGYTYIYAASGGETRLLQHFACTPIDDVDKRELTYWSADDLDGNPNHVTYEQHIWKQPISGCGVLDGVKHYEAWQVR